MERFKILKKSGNWSGLSSETILEALEVITGYLEREEFDFDVGNTFVKVLGSVKGSGICRDCRLRHSDTIYFEKHLVLLRGTFLERLGFIRS